MRKFAMVAGFGLLAAACGGGEKAAEAPAAATTTYQISTGRTMDRHCTAVVLRQRRNGPVGRAGVCAVATPSLTVQAQRG